MNLIKAKDRVLDQEDSVHHHPVSSVNINTPNGCTCCSNVTEDEKPASPKLLGDQLEEVQLQQQIKATKTSKDKDTATTESTSTTDTVSKKDNKESETTMMESLFKLNTVSYTHLTLPTT